MKEYTIDVKDKVLGRMATEVATILRGKNLPSFQPNIAPDVKVKILNVDKIKLTGTKTETKTYKRYSGYPGGLKEIAFGKVFAKDPKKVFQKAVERMLPKNKLQKVMMKNLVFES